MFFDTVANVLGDEPHRGALIVPVNATVAEAGAILARSERGALLVVHAGKLAGLLTERDVLTSVFVGDRQAGAILVGDVMTTATVTATPTDRALATLERMTRAQLRYLPVVEAGNPRGLLTLAALMDWAMTQLRVHADGALAAVQWMATCAHPSPRTASDVSPDQS
jgi:IMP dehydrogenase